MTQYVKSETTINKDKTKVMEVPHESKVFEIRIEEEDIDQVTDFEY